MRRFFANKIPLLLLFALCGCKTTHTITEVPVVVEHTTVQHHTDIVRDTLMMRDSVYHFVKGDTVIIERWHHQVKVERVMVADTVRDTVPIITEITKTETKEVNHLYWWQHALMWLGIASAVVTAFIIYRKLSSSFF